ncbi:hypothetical protein HMPREF0765_0526 [Sphingobacterium spiritivorum ATCC 33300]|uniref:Uncharacterized protein n=1 Tax=Sphingobacterium spiritivorum ATCC 33300 TaxID=525372 RepID=C2FT70_SPHSI|nr:hypothetical protein HMPREF0765_0526 [Sphingobacterium spiritivorum ATCC 33300]
MYYNVILKNYSFHMNNILKYSIASKKMTNEHKSLIGQALINVKV